MTMHRQRIAIGTNTAQLVALTRTPAFVPQPLVVRFRAGGGVPKDGCFAVAAAHGVAYLDSQDCCSNEFE